jgi:hypothetical protein
MEISLFSLDNISKIYGGDGIILLYLATLVTLIDFVGDNCE